MKVIFNNSYLEAIAKGEEVRGKPKYSADVVKAFRKKILIINNAVNSLQLREIKSLHFEAIPYVKGAKEGSYSIRVNDKYRIEFTIENDVVTITEVIVIEKLSNHYK